MVRVLNRLKSSEILKRSLPPLPIAAFFFVMATTILIFGFVMIDLGYVYIILKITMGHQYEIEIKSLLGEKTNADAFRDRLTGKGAVLALSGKQLNHYFVGNDLTKFHKNLLPLVPEVKKELFAKIVTSGKNFSIRTRQTDDKVLLV